MKKKALLIAVVAIALAVVTAASVTVAWLSAKTDPVTNTFTVGKIEIDLDETTSGYKIVPGGTDAKDPTVTVLSGSEKCFVYVLVENNLVIDGKVVGVPNIDSTKWASVGTSDNKTLYRYASEVDATTGDVKIPVFTAVTYDGEKITSANIKDLKDETIIITAYAHQSVNTTQDVADAAAKAEFGIN